MSLPFNSAWDANVSKLSESFFVINNIRKESNVSFSANRPSLYIDGGFATRPSRHPVGDQTQLRVNARHAWSVTVTGFSNFGDRIVPDSTEVEFSKNEKGSVAFLNPDGTQDTLSCVSKGTLEKRFLDLI